MAGVGIICVWAFEKIIGKADWFSEKVPLKIAQPESGGASR